MAALLVLALAALAGAAIYYASIFFRRYVLARQDHRRVLALFSRYVPSPVVEELLARKDARLFEAREYYATILCARIRNFALFAESLSPEETLRYLNEFYTIVGQAVQRHRGMIESLRGDTVTAVFGVLIEEKFQEERALRAGLDVMRVINAMEARWRAQGRKPIAVGMGVNSGKIIAGDTGYKDRREFAIVGNPAQVAARLEAASEELNAGIIASEATYDVVRELFVGVPTSSLPLRGLRRLQNAYIVRGLTRRAADDDLLTLPSQRAFNETKVHSYEAEEIPAVEPDSYIAPEETAPQQAIDERVTATAPPEFTHFSRYDDDSPALPEPPPVVGTYEDDQGPPVQLPP
ncbi:MAG TPA: adenylate/guanylate cyclase domain-containing protein [Candidatus Baltobacteraceae bacterium]|nr:adenylate/guanylate cyclase domain-containing protein [Candidatus Baltobacteraceae bacterium]